MRGQQNIKKIGKQIKFETNINLFILQIRKLQTENSWLNFRQGLFFFKF